MKQKVKVQQVEQKVLINFKFPRQLYIAIHGRVPPLGLFKRLIKLSIEQISICQILQYVLVTIILPLNNIIYPQMLTEPKQTHQYLFHSQHVPCNLFGNGAQLVSGRQDSQPEFFQAFLQWKCSFLTFLPLVRIMSFA